MFRPAVVRYCMKEAPDARGLDSNDSCLSEAMVAKCSRLCFRLAHEMIDTFNQNLCPENLTGPLPSW